MAHCVPPRDLLLAMQLQADGYDPISGIRVTPPREHEDLTGI